MSDALSQSAAATMDDHDAHPHPNYMAVFYTLFALTMAEVGITYIDMPEWMMIIVLVGMALIKAGLVGAYFMHLKYDNKVLTLIATTPLILVAIALAVVSFEYSHHTPTEAASASRAPHLHAH
jgi:cytochrome c oxidase subunit IV